jgi:hypothetical protein
LYKKAYLPAEGLCAPYLLFTIEIQDGPTYMEVVKSVKVVKIVETVKIVEAHEICWRIFHITPFQGSKQGRPACPP